MKVYEALARAFVAEGTTGVFGMMGDTNQHWITALSDQGVMTYEVRHEGSGLAMADGWYRATGSIGVCTAANGPGVAQLATTMIVASRASTPMVVFCGDTVWGDHDNAQFMNQQRFAEATEAGFVQLTSADDAYEVVRTAFYRAKTESRPIMLSAPIDVQLAEFDDFDEYTPSSTLFTATQVYPHPDAIAAASAIIAESERPVIIAGRGAQLAGAGDALLRLADRTGAIVATTLLTKNWLRDSYDLHVGISGLYSTNTAMQIFQEADCVIAIGASLNYYTTEHGYLYPNARFIQIDTRSQIVMGDGRSAECYVHADALLALDALEKQLEQTSARGTGYRDASVKDRLATALDDPSTYEIAPGTLDPRDVCRVMDEALPADISYIGGQGHQANFGTMLLKRSRPVELVTKSFSCIGNGLTTAVGAVLATGNRPAFLMEGDAGFMMHLAEFDTAVRYGVPLLAVVMNDEGLGYEYQKARVKDLDRDLTLIPSPDLGAVGVAMGARGRLVRTLDELRAAAAEFVANPGPMLVDVRISRDVISIPYRRAAYGDADA